MAQRLACPTVAFEPEHTECPQCKSALHARNSASRWLHLLDIGKVHAHASTRDCPCCDAVFRHNLPALVPAGANYAFEIIVYCGQAMWQTHKTAAEIKAELSMRGVVVRKSTVRELARRFVAYLAIAHDEAAPAMAAALQRNGGYILHLDSTSRIGSQKLLVGIDEVSGLILLSVKNEHDDAVSIAAFLRDIVARFGLPLGVCCDMASAILKALAQELSGIPVYICHFHFLRDAGKDLMKTPYKQLQRILRQGKISKHLRALFEKLAPTLSEHADSIEPLLHRLNTPASQLELQGLPPDTLLFILLASTLAASTQTDGYGFPFDRSAVHYTTHLLHSCQAVESLVELEHGSMGKTCLRHCNQALRILRPLRDSEDLRALHTDLQQRGLIFDELRTAMRMAPAGEGQGLAGAEQPAAIADIRESVTTFRSKIAERIDLIKLVEQLDRHWEKLFRAPLSVTIDGQVQQIQPQRTNNILEHHFRGEGQRQHRRTGFELSARRLNHLLPATPLVCNLGNPTYDALLLGNASDLADRFSRIPPVAVRKRLKSVKRSSFKCPTKAQRILETLQVPLHLIRRGLDVAIARLRAPNP